jgi:hypothetical protein
MTGTSSPASMSSLRKSSFSSLGSAPPKLDLLAVELHTELGAAIAAQCEMSYPVGQFRIAFSIT